LVNIDVFAAFNSFGIVTNCNLFLSRIYSTATNIYEHIIVCIPNLLSKCVVNGFWDYINCILFWRLVLTCFMCIDLAIFFSSRDIWKLVKTNNQTIKLKHMARLKSIKVRSDLLLYYVNYMCICALCSCLMHCTHTSKIFIDRPDWHDYNII